MQKLKLLKGYKTKVAGIIVSAIGIILTILTRILPNPIINYRLTADQNLQLFLWVAIVGFCMIAFSREKNDDERVQLIRGKSMTVAFAMMAAVTLSINIVGILHPKLTLSAGTDMFLFPAFGLGVYLLYFNIGLYFDKAWNYAADETLFGNLEKKKLFLIIYTVIGLGLLFLLRVL